MPLSSKPVIKMERFIFWDIRIWFNLKKKKKRKIWCVNFPMKYTVQKIVVDNY